MNEMATVNGGPATVSADEGDVPNSVLGIGYEPDVLDSEEEDEELAAAEAALEAPADAPAGELPGEGAPASAEAEGAEPAAVYTADQGDVPGTAIGVGYDPATMAQAEEWDDLSEAEAGLLPGEAPTASQAPVIQPPAGMSGWFKREPLLAALVLANAPILATLVKSITEGNETLSILAGSATLVLNVVVGAARNAVTPTANPKLAELTPLVPSGSA